MAPPQSVSCSRTVSPRGERKASAAWRIGPEQVAIFGTTDTFTSTVDRAGEANTPYSRFPVLRVNTTLEQSIPLTVFRRALRTYAFITECGGLVARVASVENDTAENFTRASEYRRLNL